MTNRHFLLYQQRIQESSPFQNIDNSESSSCGFQDIASCLQQLYNALLFHLPSNKLNDEEKELICKNGLIHFTTEENATKIMENGFEGKISKCPLLKAKWAK